MTPYQHHVYRSSYSISVVEEILLDIVDRYIDRYTVTDLMKCAEEMKVASPATLHTAISNLNRAGYIDLMIDKKDRRVRNIKITRSGKSYLKGLSK